MKTGRLRRIIDRHDVAALAVSERTGVAPVGATTTVELGALGTVTVTAIDADSRVVVRRIAGATTRPRQRNQHHHGDTCRTCPRVARRPGSGRR